MCCFAGEAGKCLLAHFFQTWCEGGIDQMRGSKDAFGEAMSVGRMDVALDHLVLHQPVDHVSCFTLGRTDYGAVEQGVTHIDERVEGDSFVFAKVFEGIVGVQGVNRDLHLAAITTGMPLVGVTLKSTGQLQFLHRVKQLCVGRLDVFQRETPIDRVFQCTRIQSL